METFLDIFMILAIVCSVLVNVVFIEKLHKLERLTERKVENDDEILNELEESVAKVNDRVKHVTNLLDMIREDLIAQIDRCTLAMREKLDPAKPIRTNNWDSMKKAFKAPARIDLNERD